LYLYGIAERVLGFINFMENYRCRRSIFGDAFGERFNRRNRDVKIPENYFSSHYQEDFLPTLRGCTRWGVVIGKKHSRRSLDNCRNYYVDRSRTGSFDDSDRV
jgi:hypothetical protein